MKKTISMGISGEAGSFSEQAAIEYLKPHHIQASFIYLLDMEGVLAAVENGAVEQGIFPIINLRGGLVKPSLIAMGNHLFTPVDDYWLEVHQCLLVLPGTPFESIKKIASHPQGLAQCREYLQNKFPNAELLEWSDTAKAAQDLSIGKLSANTAVIAPARSAIIYNLEVKTHNIEDVKPNLTAFIIVKQRR